ncbi:MAG: hypothetical protein IAE77_25760 [Prosthecobacter sp.]|uniref:hypothetical protein n=1 Tax=Prosthecobacter sp. TaxID=1965333 RepID=UPI0019DCE667|nr:hypothetical protein [Prosthecobacter sp.]MBE2286889.1 hypothetical protein [Prosthecobacter sp.]
MIPAKLVNGLRLLYHLFRDYRHAPRWLSDRLVRKDMLDRRIPWLTWGAVDHLGKVVRPGMRVLEWGGGGSTLYFLDRGCRVTTIETDSGWAEGLRSRSKSSGTSGQLELRLMAHPSAGEAAATAYLQAVEDPACWDLVLVDGPGEISRVECIRRAMPFVNAGGFIVLDNADWPAFADAPKLLAGWDRKVFSGLIPCARGTGQTDVYWKPHSACTSG